MVWWRRYGAIFHLKDSPPSHPACGICSSSVNELAHALKYLHGRGQKPSFGRHLLKNFKGGGAKVFWNPETVSLGGRNPAGVDQALVGKSLILATFWGWMRPWGREHHKERWESLGWASQLKFLGSLVVLKNIIYLLGQNIANWTHLMAIKWS